MFALALTVAWVAVSQVGSEAAVPEDAETFAAEAGAETQNGIGFRVALEASAQSFPSGTPGGSQDLFLLGTPILAIDGGEEFAFELGADLRLRVFDDPPAQRAGDFGGLLRREDFDEPSDFGQLLRALKLGSGQGALSVRAGPVDDHTLGKGFLVSRYDNRRNPNYHPAAASMLLFVGPTKIEAFASDVLGGRLFAGEVALDVARTFGMAESAFDTYHLSASFAHDLGRAGGMTAPITLMHVDVDAALHKGEHHRVVAYLGLGSRVGLDYPPLGAVLGILADAEPEGVAFSGKLELRKQGGGFRHGMFGPGYELGRFSKTGLAQEPLAAERMPDAASGYLEARLTFAEGAVSLSGSAELFGWGRTDLDALVAARFLEDKAALGLRGTVEGLGQVPRSFVGGEGRYRFAEALYALAGGGTVFFPQPNGALVRGVYLGVGVGVDFER